MFTGIIEEVGKIRQITNKSIEIECRTVSEDAKLGDSICVNGICLTVIDIKSDGFTANVSPETFKVTSLKSVKTGDFVNLERAMKADGRFGGHIVSGHTDNTGKVKFIKKSGDFYVLGIEISAELSKYVIKKGSIAVNGISLTIAEIKKNIIEIAVIPHTYENTNLKYLKPENHVNIEVDMFAKYIENFLSRGDNRSRIDENFLVENGYL